MKWTHLLIPLIFFVGFSNCKIQCNHNDQCTCYQEVSRVELQCPKNFSDYGGLLIHIVTDSNDNENILIDCFNGSSTTLGSFSYFDAPSSEVKTLTSFDMNWLPYLPIEKVAHFEIRYCPLPNTHFKSISDKFSIKELKTLQIEIKDNFTLNEGYFENLESIEALKLDVIGPLTIEANAFNNTPNIINIDLKGDILKLDPNIFQTTPILKSLDITQSHLETLPQGIFKNLRNLKILSLWSNELTEIDDLIFSDLENLKLLELSYNKITNISEDAFKSLVNLNATGLARNSLTTLPSNLFQHNVNLVTVKMYDNYNLVLPDHLFANLKSLNDVSLSNCNLKIIPEHVFENSTNIKILELNNNLLTTLPEMVFKGLENLERLDLQSNKIENISNVILPRKIKILNLENNLITSIEKDTFIYLRNLQEINLRRNRISKIHYYAFNHENLANLKVIDLSYNQISEANVQHGPMNFAIFQNVIGLTHIDLSHNLITRIEDIISLESKTNLTLLDLRHNTITEVTVRNLLSLLPPGNKLEVKLDWNNITTVDFLFADKVGPDEQDLDAFHNTKVAYTVISIGNNPLKCDCSNYDLFRYFQGDLPPKVKILFKIRTENATCVSPYDNGHYSVVDFPLSLAICPLQEVLNDYRGCPETCVCYWKPSSRSVVVDCSDRNFIALPDIVLPNTRYLNYNQTEIYFENNNLTEGPRPNMTAYSNATTMVLSNNKIKTISWLPPKLQVLKLHNNSLTKLDYEVLKVLNASQFLNVTLNNNPWTCDCSAENLTHLLRQRRYVDGRHVYCFNTTTPLISMSRKDLCNGGLSVLVIILPVMTFLLILAILAALYYRYQQELKVWLYANDCCLWWVTEEDLDKDKVYDAFISFSHKDEDFVSENLLPILEGKEGYKLCIHYRNWVPGEFISKQVTNSVCESRRTVIVLSENFLESVWGKLEFRTAHTQAMSEGRARVIVILYGEIDVNSLDNELKMYLKTNTYIKWGDPYFWEKMKYALPHSHKKISSSQKHANMMNFIDDKFKLVAPVTASPGTTPPVLALDPSLLKKHPLSFVPTPEMDTPPAEAGTLLTVTTE